MPETGIPVFKKEQAPTMLKTEVANLVRDWIGSLANIEVKITYDSSNELSAKFICSPNNSVLALKNFAAAGVSGGSLSVDGYDSVPNVYFVVNGTLYTGEFLIKDQTAV